MNAGSKRNTLIRDSSLVWGDTAPGISNVELQNDLGEYALMKVREQENGGEGAKPLVKALTRESLGGSVTSRGDDVILR